MHKTGSVRMCVSRHMISTISYHVHNKDSVRRFVSRHTINTVSYHMHNNDGVYRCASRFCYLVCLIQFCAPASIDIRHRFASSKVFADRASAIDAIAIVLPAFICRSTLQHLYVPTDVAKSGLMLASCHKGSQTAPLGYCHGNDILCDLFGREFWHVMSWTVPKFQQSMEAMLCVAGKLYSLLTPLNVSKTLHMMRRTHNTLACSCLPA